MKKKSELEVMDDSIEAMMDKVAAHSGIKRQNSYVVLAHILESYSERCLKLSEQKQGEGET